MALDHPFSMRYVGKALPEGLNHLLLETRNATFLTMNIPVDVFCHDRPSYQIDLSKFSSLEGLLSRIDHVDNVLPLVTG